MRRVGAEIIEQTSGKFPGMDNRALGSLYFQRYIVAAITSPQEWYLLQGICSETSRKFCMKNHRNFAEISTEENSSQVQRVLTVIGGGDVQAYVTRIFADICVSDAESGVQHDAQCESASFGQV
jgi:hypothetical protein